jgi:hypothetical protein
MRDWLSAHSTAEKPPVTSKWLASVVKHDCIGVVDLETRLEAKVVGQMQRLRA